MNRIGTVWRINLFCCALFSCGSFVQASSTSNSTTPKTWIVCVSGFDLYRYTYGFEAGIYRLCGALAGQNKENVIIISPDTAAYHVKNAIPGKVVHGQRFLDDKSENVYEYINVAYKSEDVTEDVFYGILSGNKTKVKGIGNERVVHSGPLDTVILVFINIGDYGVMTLTNDEYLFAEKFVPFIEDLRENNKFRQMLILVDGQNAGSMFDGYLCTDCSIIAWTNTAKQDDLELCLYNSDVSAFTSTCFTYILAQHLEKLLKDKKLADETTLFDLYQQIRTKAWFLDSQSNLYGDLRMGNAKITQVMKK